MDFLGKTLIGARWVKERAVALRSNIRAACSDLDFPGGIDRIFRFLEMAAIAGLISLVYSIVDARRAFEAGFALTALAGAYLVWPFMNALGTRRGSGTLTIVLFSLGCGSSLAVVVSPLQTLLRATIQIDKVAARRDYAREIGKQVSFACARRGHWPPETCATAGKEAEQRKLSEMVANPSSR